MMAEVEASNLMAMHDHDVMERRMKRKGTRT
jgi:hypothetical protein